MRRRKQMVRGVDDGILGKENGTPSVFVRAGADIHKLKKSSEGKKKKMSEKTAHESKILRYNTSSGRLLTYDRNESEELTDLDYRRVCDEGQSPTDQLPPYLEGEYRCKTGKNIPMSSSISLYRGEYM
jgi:hypothetical protein